ncbi:putative uncharacterized protein [Prevotella sp. CAG:5226]|jgi:hypothetical protein|nr:putative uncharacterized protein [Prevotella sp. CAG:5226]
MRLFYYTSCKEFNTFEELYKSNAYAVCNLLKKFSVNVHTIGEYKELLEQYSKLPVIEDIDKDLFGCYVLKETNDAKDTISGIIINDELCSQLKLTTNDKLAAIAHEIGHIMFFFLENKQIDEEFKADEFACQMGLSVELLGLLEKLQKSGIYNEHTTRQLELRLKAIKKYRHYFNA